MDLRLTDRHIMALNFLLIAVLAYFAAGAVNDVIALRMAPTTTAAPRATRRRVFNDGAVTRPRGAYQEIVNRDIFNIAPPPQIVAPVVEKIDLQLDLIGVSTASTGKEPYAIIANRSGEQGVFKLGQQVGDAGKLVEVDKDRVLIDHRGKRIALVLPESDLPGGVEAAVPDEPPQEDASADDPDAEPYEPNVEDLGDNRYRIPRDTLDHSMGNLSQILTQIRAIPNIQNGKTNGFALSEIEPGSVFDEMGLEEGDVLRSVNGQQMNDPALAMQMMSSLRNANQISIQVLREGHPTTLNYQIQ
jgi:general secretion pathway protein C